MRNSSAINLVNLANLTMHRLLHKPNQSGSFEKMVLDTNPSNNHQIRFLYVTKDATIMEAKIQDTFITHLRDIISKSRQNHTAAL